ncbi:hypothetical protein TREMEDRAFT_24461 [Tremella mesenterica DSM 1558]|uniref:uncharacterized protein n=1 Tax=Tremella mesenterica (strain ATCC 24925 / CBS 8224 / DSM 1558 / NBRC 9311 / NRRL Y-6157 / RJB 2259-6 / UBC 559-6) TaxID=578456 RepID=UPI0003F4A2D8|nr:uncharacterized protein TREMEDRAFT_24461 [Tremella mesenterica DSM 1558]EIW73098.1 hypothetical protein TREMEDRAFT_24461 [Tremella mesenterica DSM 1558]
MSTITSNGVKAYEAASHELTLPSSEPRPILIIVMGPGSCGKSTIGESVSRALHLPFVDGDSLHPQSNIDKMSSGTPLNDDDRLPWLALIRSTAERVCKEQWDKKEVYKREEGGVGRAGVIIACSALKRWYRDILRGIGDAPIDHPHATSEKKAHKPATDNLLTLFLYCRGSRILLEERISARQGHFFGPKMLDSQLTILEDPVTSGEEGVAVVDIEGGREDVARRAERSVRELVGSEEGMR